LLANILKVCRLLRDQRVAITRLSVGNECCQLQQPTVSDLNID